MRLLSADPLKLNDPYPGISLPAVEGAVCFLDGAVPQFVKWVADIQTLCNNAVIINILYPLYPQIRHPQENTRSLSGHMDGGVPLKDAITVTSANINGAV